ncbi:hypothetical protein F5884DRAFT_755977 [Xylogone sp. PMI_703]|nr:hypothetical protein F5884DRAFT_755977 [Xylogone sp. PMI_703]
MEQYRHALQRSRADKPFVPLRSTESGRYRRLEARHLEATGSSYPSYPQPIPPEKYEKARELYLTYKEMVALYPSPSPRSRADSVLSDKSSVLSFANKTNASLDLSAAYTKSVASNGQRVKGCRRSAFTPVGRAKTALIRCLGSCSTCRDRRVPCPLDHHDIESLESVRKPDSQHGYANDGTSYQKWKDVELQIAGVSGGPEVDESLVCKPAPAQVLNSSIYEDSAQDIPDVSSLSLTSADTSTKIPRTNLVQAFKDDEAKHSGPPREGARDMSPIDWGAGLAKAVKTAYNAVFGSAPVSPALLFRLYSIFDNESFSSSETESDFDEGSFNSTPWQPGGSSDASSASGYPQAAPTEPLSTSCFTEISNLRVPEQVPSDDSTPPKVKAVKSTGIASGRVKRRLRCLLNARFPYKYCSATGTRFRACSKDGALTFAHLKQHLFTTHEGFRCDRCGKLFSNEEDKANHSRVDVSEMCHVIPEDAWPTTHQTESIDKKVKDRINEKLSARGYQQLDSATKFAIESWISANITEYVGENPLQQDKLALRNWYLVWLTLFPGVPVPSHPFCEEGYIKLVREMLRDSAESGRLSLPPQDLGRNLDEIIECVRRALEIVRNVTHETQNNTHSSVGESNVPNFRTPSRTSPSVSGAVHPRAANRPPPAKRRKNNPRPSLASSHVDTVLTPASSSIVSPPEQIAIQNINPVVNTWETSSFGPIEQSQQPGGTDLLNFDVPVSQLTAYSDPWSSNNPRLGDEMQMGDQIFSPVSDPMISYPVVVDSHGTPTTTSFQDLTQDVYNDEWFNTDRPFGSEENENERQF